MWETTKLPQGAVSCLNRARCVIVPSTWNKQCFEACGVKVPIHVVPLGINTDVFRPQPMKMTGPCVFGAAGRMAHGGVRKGINQVIEAFQQAFPGKEDVRLHIKGFPDCDILPVTDPRIKVTKEYMSEEALAKWFAGLTCFVSAAKGEGWGLMQHQAMAVGRPIISIVFGGVAEFFEPKLGYRVRYRLAPASGHYVNCGDWAEPSQNDLIRQMRGVFSNRKTAKARGLKASAAVNLFTWEAANQQLVKVLKSVGLHATE